MKKRKLKSFKKNPAIENSSKYFWGAIVGAAALTAYFLMSGKSAYAKPTSSDSSDKVSSLLSPAVDSVSEPVAIRELIDTQAMVNDLAARVAEDQANEGISGSSSFLKEIRASGGYSIL